MQTSVKKWGNSLAIRLPSAIIESFQLNDNVVLDIKIQKDKIILSKKNELDTLIKQINENNLHSDDFTILRGKEW